MKNQRSRKNRNVLPLIAAPKQRGAQLLYSTAQILAVYAILRVHNGRPVSRFAPYCGLPLCHCVLRTLQYLRYAGLEPKTQLSNKYSALEYSTPLLWGCYERGLARPLRLLRPPLRFGRRLHVMGSGLTCRSFCFDYSL